MFCVTFTVGFLLHFYSFCPSSLVIYFVSSLPAATFFFFFLISTMSDFSRKAKEEQIPRINPFYTHLFNTSFNALFQ